jgi:ferredoxin-type protein NapF
VAEPINRAQFLRGDLYGERHAIRPPWARPEAQFVERCVRCDDCIARCPQHIIRRGAGGYPRIDFGLGACTFCGDCVRACRQDALAFAADPAQPPWRLQVEFKTDCLARNGVICRSCGERCEENAIHFHLHTRGHASPVLDADACNGCGDCVSACPLGAIRIHPLPATQAA